MAGPAQRFRQAFAPHPSDNVWLDAVRTLAIALVLLRHGQRLVITGAELTWWEAFKLNGWAGVDLFFVLSGYLVTAGLLRRYQGGGIALGDYAMKRVRRIVPAFLAVMALVVIGYFPGFEVPSDNILRSVLTHMFFMQDIAGNDINVVFWSLGVEAKFYALVPLVVWAAFRLRQEWILILAALGFVALGVGLRGVIFAMNPPEDYLSYLQALRWPFYACVEPFALGVLVALLEQRGLLRLRPQQAAWVFAGLLAALAIYLSQAEFLADITLWDATIQPLFLAVLFAMLVAMAVIMKPIETRFAAPFRWGARISYALYLVHLPLIPISLKLALLYDLGVSGFWVIYLGLSILHAVLVLVYVERPFLVPKAPAKAVVERPT